MLVVVVLVVALLIGLVAVLPAVVAGMVTTTAAQYSAPSSAEGAALGDLQVPVSAAPDARAGGAGGVTGPVEVLVTPSADARTAQAEAERASRAGDRTPASAPADSGGTGAAARPAPEAPQGDPSVAAQVIALVNDERAAAGCGQVSAEDRLTSSAQGHSDDMAANDYFDHDSQDGRTFDDRIRAAGYDGGAIAENIAAGQPDAAAVMAGWMDSPGHRANILNCTYSDIGVGIARGGSMGIYWTQNFGG